MNRCRHIRTSDGDHAWVTEDHRTACDDPGCPGCAPCTAPHCWRCRRTHLDNAHPVTCASCVGRTRDDLDAIERLYALLPEEAVERGVNSEAANLAGPAADPEASQWYRGYMWRTTGTIEPADPHHPLTVLGTWDFMLREDLDQPTTALVTVSRARAYLDGLLTWLAQADDQDFPLFAEEIRVCRAHLEDVLHEGERVERGVPCPACLEQGNDHPARLVREYHHHDKTGAKDRWVCPADHEHWWTEAAYRLRVGSDHLQHAPELTADQLAKRLELKASTIRRWAGKQKRQEPGEDPVYDPPLLRSVGKSHDGRRLYRVADVAELAEQMSVRGA